VHRFDDEARTVADLAARFVATRLAEGAPLGATASPAALTAALGRTITEEGIGATEAFRRFEEVLAPATVGLDSSRFLAFIPAAPTAVAALFDGVVSASSFSGESWLEAAGAIHAENEVLAFLAELAGLPPGAGGCFVSGGSAGNLSALAVARAGGPNAVAGGETTWMAVADTVHSSVANALDLLGVRAVVVPTGPDGVMTGAVLRAAIQEHGRPLRAVIASAGSTNAGVIDDLAGCAEVTDATGAWFHVDGAYGLAGLLAPSVRERFAGIERADSFIVDPHKWLFGPLDCCALVYREPERARAVHTQHAPYLEALHVDDAWNPADLAFHLTRRTRGLPVWFSLATHGVAAYRAAIQRGLDLARAAADRVRALGPPVELVMEPTLSVVLFRRAGWTEDDWYAWSRGLLEDGVAFVTPTHWKGETVGRLVFLHPDTDAAVVEEVLARLRGPGGLSPPGGRPRRG
jgi:glutamate/tyrosine decarboxylase-like PLP-dependent enzyme